MDISDILANSFVVTGGGIRLRQFRRCLSAAGLDASLVREWRWCRIPGEGSMGNAVAQYSLVRHALESKMPFLVVFEDDAVPCDDAAVKIVEAFESRGRKDLCLTLGWNYSSDGKKERGDNRRVYGSHAYALFGEKAYRSYIEAWEKNGRADIVLGAIRGSRMSDENLFAQHTPEGAESIHLPQGWSAEAELERAVDGELGRRFLAVEAELDRIRRESEMHVAYTVDVQGQGAVQFINQMIVSVYSLRKNMSPSDRIVVHILYANVTADLMAKLNSLVTDRFAVEWVKIKPNDLQYMQTLTKNNPHSRVRSWSGIVFARLWLPLALPSVKRVVYTDADTVFRSSIRPLWNTDMKGNFIACPKGTVYEYRFYSGLMVMDCEAIRKDQGFYGRLGAFLENNARKFMLPDQTSINEFFKDAITEVDMKWCYPPTPGKNDPRGMNNAAIWHFYEGGKPVRLDADDFGKGCVYWNMLLAEAEERSFGFRDSGSMSEAEK